MTPIVELSSVTKNYQGLRPLRVAAITIGPADRVALLGVDQVTAEVLVNLITGTSLPDTGDVRLFGTSTASLADAADWLSLIDRIGIVSERAVLLDGLSVVQNLAMPYSLEIEPPAPELRARAVALAQEVALPEPLWDDAVGKLDAGGRLRVRLGRALALNPAVLLLEHPSAALDRRDVAEVAALIAGVVERRNVAALALTADVEFAEAFDHRPLVLEPATGRVRDASRRRGWFGRRDRSL